ncbi:hypothetical protein [Komagataeibacter sp. FNDCF1]|uniref:hypothetical protein n=1 Tax=Komagataeibacter sp. FNDCF1 TaxID=2878681 RepID=UPI001E4C8CB1|nr:hypothetical protein [Komagataeibacter sp. FNDCF1]MCE2563174.1 hypothetical protein [Komagataeibacter sp. FNDCF1]
MVSRNLTDPVMKMDAQADFTGGSFNTVRATALYQRMVAGGLIITGGTFIIMASCNAHCVT